MANVTCGVVWARLLRPPVVAREGFRTAYTQRLGHLFFPEFVFSHRFDIDLELKIQHRYLETRLKSLVHDASHCCTR